MEHEGYYAVTTRGMLREAKTIGRVPFILFQYYLTYLTAANGIRPSLDTIAEDLDMEKTAVCNARATLVKNGWIEYENEQVRITKTFISNERDSSDMNADSSDMNQDSFKMNGTEVAKIGCFKKEEKEEYIDALHYVPCDEDGIPLPAKKEKRKKSFRTLVEPRAPRTARTTSDERLKHPIIVAVREIMGYFPDASLRDELIEQFGEAFDLAKLKKCRAAWVKKGYRSAAFTWTDWYFTGIPVYAGGNDAAEQKPNKWNHTL